MDGLLIGRKLWLFILGVLLLACVLPSTSRADVLVLLGGDELRGEVVIKSDRYVILYHADLGRLTILRSKVESIRYDAAAAETPEQSEAADDTPEAPDSGVDGAIDASDVRLNRRDNWEASLTLGGVLTNDEEGEKISLNTAFDAKKITPTSETDVHASYFLKFDDGDIDDHEATIFLNQRWRRAGSRWYRSIRPRYDFDEFRSWTHRLQAHGAIGYYLKETPTVRWTGEIGAGYRRDFGSISAAEAFEGLVGTDLDWQISEVQSLSFEVTSYQQIQDVDQRVVTRSDWRIRIAEQPDLNFRIGIEHEYATDPDPGFPRNNVRLTTGIELKF